MDEKENRINIKNALIYHGGYVAIEFPEIIKGKYAKDFGNGFYCTELKEQAIRWAERFDTSVISMYNYIQNKDLNIKTFEEMTETWLDFVADCRAGKQHDYDIVSGPMANDQIYNYVADYISGMLTREQFWILAKFKRPTHQICFCSKDALGCLIFINSERYAGTGR